ncbi:hypothetical protein PUF88_06130 [Lactobacillaceae bacterium L1_55_11]|nr:hypothetical protein [Lactobacillaceae bacterium L1_55_11]
MALFESWNWPALAVGLLILASQFAITKYARQPWLKFLLPVAYAVVLIAFFLTLSNPWHYWILMVGFLCLGEGMFFWIIGFAKKD